MGAFVTTNVRLSKDLLTKLKFRAVEENKSVAQLVREAIQQHLSQHQLIKIDYDNDPFNDLIGITQSEIIDGSVNHDHYLYGTVK